MRNLLDVWRAVSALDRELYDIQVALRDVASPRCAVCGGAAWFWVYGAPICWRCREWADRRMG